MDKKNNLNFDYATIRKYEKHTNWVGKLKDIFHYYHTEINTVDKSYSINRLKENVWRLVKDTDQKIEAIANQMINIHEEIV